MSFTTANKIKLHLWGDTTSTQYDSLWSQLLLMVDDYITEYTGVPVGSSVPTITNEIVDSNGTTKFMSKYHPITELTTVERRDANNEWETYSGVYEEIATGEIEFDDYDIYSKYVIYPKAKRAIRITYKAGYADAGVPDDLALAATLIACAIFNRRNTEGLKSQNVLDISATIGDEIPAMAKRILNKYKKVYAL